MKIKLITVAGTRPELIRLSEIIKKFDKNFEHTLVYTNQNYDIKLKNIFISELGIRKPNYELKLKNKSSLSFIGKMILEIEKILLKEKPDAFFILGDTNSCLSALVAKKLKIPIFHYEAGNRCFDNRVPEEINRKVIDNLSDINLTYSDFAKQNLLLESFKNDRVIKVGSPLKEVFLANKTKINSSDILKKLKLKKNQYILVSYHREENVDDLNKLNKFLNIINSLKSHFKKKIILSTHPRTMLRLKKIKYETYNNIIFSEPFGYIDYMNLQINSLVVISDSGSIPEENSLLNFKSIILRDTFERQEIFENESIIMSQLDKNYLINCINRILNKKKVNKTYKDYDDNEVSSKIVNIILSYIPFINNYILRK